MRRATVQEVFEAAAAEMRKSGCTEKTVRNHRQLFGMLERECPDGVYDSAIGRGFAEATANAEGRTYAPRYRRQRKRTVAICERYVAGEKPCTGSHIGGKTLQPRSLEHLRSLKALDEYAEERDLADKTLSDYRYTASMYLAYLEGLGVARLDDAGASTVAGFLAHLACAGSKSPKSLVVSHLRPLFVAAGRDDLYRATQMVGARQPHAPHPILDDDEERDLVEACVGGGVSPAAAAATLLALTTGLRGSDIAALELSDIDWRDMRIATVQRKTGDPVTVPLLPAVAGVLADYISEGRPETGDSHVFLGTRPPFGPYKSPSSIRDLIETAFSAAGIEGVPAGTRTLRHNAATRMLRSGSVQLATISAVLGHADLATTEGYLESDEGRMLECVLPLPKGAFA
ncbi:MAG: site-specific integrase [Eggerthellaceae bacterium]|jgi:integrase